jgi:hypothetical protein
MQAVPLGVITRGSAQMIKATLHVRACVVLVLERGRIVSEISQGFTLSAAHGHALRAEVCTNCLLQLA